MKSLVRLSLLAAFVLWGVPRVVGRQQAEETEMGSKPNVLFIAVDDLNDWVGCLGGHPQAKTPHIDRLANKSVLFEQAYCASPICNPSRTSVMTGLRPTTSGFYVNESWFRDSPALKHWTTLPQYFRKHGYVTLTGGKIYHHERGEWSDPDSWDQQYTTRMGTPAPAPKDRFKHGLKGKFLVKYNNSSLDWGAIQQPKEQTADWKTADGAAKFLKQKHDKPFFLACGIFRPHLSWYAPKEYFDMHPIDELQLPVVLENDLEDVPPKGHLMAGKDFPVVKAHGQWKNAVQGYLASTSFADACVGHVLDALEDSEYRDNTIIVLWGDHGFHVGQKDHIAKWALWQQSTQTPLIIHIPDALTSDGKSLSGRCSQPVSLTDLYPTLVELCGLPMRGGLDGRSLVPLVRNPDAEWPWPVVITHAPPKWGGMNHAIRTRDFHFIQYCDGKQELYDAHLDPHQWKNLANDPKYKKDIEKLKEWIPLNCAKHYQASPIGE